MIPHASTSKFQDILKKFAPESFGEIYKGLQELKILQQRTCNSDSKKATLHTLQFSDLVQVKFRGNVHVYVSLNWFKGNFMKDRIFHGKHRGLL